MLFCDCDERFRPEFDLLEIAGKERNGPRSIRERMTSGQRMIGVFDCESRLYASLIRKSQ
jgi:hypothetical protein